MGIVIVIALVAAWAFWVAYEVNKAGGYPPYQDSVQCNQNCNQGRDCDCYQRSCDMTVEEYKNWPFPRSKP